MPLSRFGRNYELRIEVDGRAVIVRPPIRITFSADKSSEGSLNRLDLQVYNLQESNRLAIAKDRESQDVINLQLAVGYRDKLEPLFRGTIQEAVNRREGSEIVTEIECLDGGIDYQFAEIDRTVGAGSDVIDAILRDMSNTERGAIADRQRLIRPKVMSGRAPRVINSIVGDNENWFIDNERLNIIGENDVVGEGVPVVSPATGLLETPERAQQKVTALTRFNPSVRIGGRFKLESTLAPQMNGVYKALTMSYEGDLDGDTWDQSITGLPITAPEVLSDGA